MKNYQEYSDSDLVKEYMGGKEKAFSVLVTRHKSRVYTTIYMIVKDHCATEDLLQETFIKAIDTVQAGKYNEEGKFLPWISRIAYNLAIDYFRRQKRYSTVNIEDGRGLQNRIEFSEDSIESTKIKGETHQKLKRLIYSLPDSQKEVLLMRHYMKMSFQEIADSTGVSINTSLGRMRYALINLRKQMDKHNLSGEQVAYLR